MIRRLILALLVLTVMASAAAAQVHVRGYTRRDGTYVQPHYRSSPDGNPSNNWSTRGNVNPYTGQYGTHQPLTPYTPLPTAPYVVLPQPPLSPYEAGYLVPRR
jgi:opacity protein-like surface antigen